MPCPLSAYSTGYKLAPLVKDLPYFFCLTHSAQIVNDRLQKKRDSDLAITPNMVGPDECIVRWHAIHQTT